ncbi:SulP family inorganic anion transporter [Shewanella sp. NIFS-20-20]|uniref:SulP family inorganic anion transporter n=1 Tax=Shewanella sp. NIFS-20-20 TaxID=2853806 RepID=UPI001C43D32A|nr:SulP family inorganic anion transporter [Shewanella sp. NIFS-20-20]MBV7316737.1 SulP family inorganic anion transporter [Shewanella sp. NIFS-20-20]
MFSQGVQALFPGINLLGEYQQQWFKDDLRAGVSVAAVALPVAVAYAQLTGVNPMAGLYSCILPMLVYAMMGTSRQLIIGPDAATCAVIAAVVAPLAAGDPVKYWQLAITMSLMTGVWCLIASKVRLGLFADFLSKPILLGLLNGVAITIIVGQLSKIIGVKFDNNYLLERILSIPNIIQQLHILTMVISLLCVLIFFLVKRLRPEWPAAMVAMAISALVVWLFNLDSRGVAIVGPLSGGLPEFQTPNFELGILRELVIPALNLALVSFVSMMLTARSFAAKNNYEIDADQEFRALGVANIASALSQGFAISGADSRTAVNDANGGRTQLVSIIAAAIIAIVALFLTAPLQYIPLGALSVVLVIASVSLIDLKAIWLLKRRDKTAFVLSVVTLSSVIFIGVIPGITLAVLLGLFQFILVVMRPTDQVLGLDRKGILRSIDSSDKAKGIPSVLIFRFNSPLTYFNAVYFKRQLLLRIKQQPEPIECVIVDAVSCFSHLDLSVMTMLQQLHHQLKNHGCRLVLAGRKRQLLAWFDIAGIPTGDGAILVRSDLYLAIRMNQAYKEALKEGEAPLVRKEPDTNAILSHSML